MVKLLEKIHTIVGLSLKNRESVTCLKQVTIEFDNSNTPTFINGLPLDLITALAVDCITTLVVD